MRYGKKRIGLAIYSDEISDQIEGKMASGKGRYGTMLPRSHVLINHQPTIDIIARLCSLWCGAA